MIRFALSLGAAACFCSTATAGFISEDVPSWRGEANTAYYNWENFSSAGAATGPNMPGNEPFPSGNALLFNFGEGALISGDNNIYGFGGPLNIHTYGYTQSDAQQAVFNFSTAGSLIDYSSAMLVWNDGVDGGESGMVLATVSVNYSEEADFGGFIGYFLNVSWSFDLSGIDADIRQIGMIWQSEAAHTSLDAAAMDIQFAAVPAPGVLALLGLAGVAGRRRRRC